MFQTHNTEYNGNLTSQWPFWFPICVVTISIFTTRDYLKWLQSVPEKMKLEIFIGMEIGMEIGIW